MSEEALREAAAGAGVSAPAQRIARGTPQYRRTSLAIFSCGFSIFAILYCTQPILPALAEEFSVTPAQSSLALSLTTITMAIAMVFASSLSEAFGRKPLMLGAVFFSSVFTLGLAFATQWEHVLWLRALAGVALSGMPAVTLAYMGEEFEKDAVAPAVGLYIGGGAVGGMSGRLLTSFLADHGTSFGAGVGDSFGSWRLAMAAIALTGLVSTFIFWRALAPSRHFVAREFSPVALTRSLLGHMTNIGIVLMVVVGFLMLGAYMALFNYVGFRLQARPFDLSQSIAGLIFVIYPIGSLGSAHMGALAARFGRGRMLIAAIVMTIAGTIIMTPDSLIAIGAGLIILTYGFFGVHAICSGWAPALAERDKAQASSLYLLFYYIGGGVAGTFAGVFWAAHGWNGVALFSLAAMAVALVLAFAMSKLASTQ